MPDAELPTNASQPAVSVIIVTWNSAAVIGDCLRSLVENPPNRPWEVVVVDNASSDDTLGAVRRSGIAAALITNRSNRGLAAANNQGMLAARGDYFVISNPDVAYREGAIDALVDLLDRRPRAAFAFARLQGPDGEIQTCAGDLPTVGDALVGRAARRNATNIRSGFWWHGWSHDEEVAIGHGGEACYATRRSTVAALGLQDESFRLDWEGVEWTRRAIDQGMQVWFSPRAHVVHTGGASIKRIRLRWVASTHRGMYRYFAPRSPAAARPLLAAAIAGRALAKVLAMAVGAVSYDKARDSRGAPGAE